MFVSTDFFNAQLGRDESANIVAAINDKACQARRRAKVQRESTVESKRKGKEVVHQEGSETDMEVSESIETDSSGGESSTKTD